ncbi:MULTISPECIES: bacillithiol system redox-active protein YtxJ [Bacillus]|uniref:bacillithiol system redox-active protein YtxJ n=1 Tax=Bacillus TaxID=1386 RepID=UPI000C78B669|nr:MULTISPECIES: bacillithiol system redox-active protein YtxJ [Bacillus]PLR83814.1 bacillithiol system redox-active protein YtxJ [Bacillus sp. V33-4]RSK48213.1 bacillithiol system redox-active protein YtxJ [Bacillus canaveralius]
MNKINTVEQFDDAVNNGAFLILKHSTTCPISQAAYEEFEKFTEDHPKVNSYYLTVQDARPLSNHIAEKYDIKHESPQALLFTNSGVAWHASHWKITYETLANVLAENK